MTTTTLRNTRRESQDDYVGVVLTQDDHRVSLCRDGLQWLLQRRVNKARGIEWKSLSFCVTAKALAREWRSKVGTEPPPEITVALPDAHKAPVRRL